MAAAVKVKNTLFFTIKDGTYKEAEEIITSSSLVALGARYKPTDQTTLFFAAARQCGQDKQASALCRMLMERGIPVDHTDELNQTALFYAARQGHAEAIRYLLRKGANPNVIDKYGETPIFYAVSKKRVECVQVLLDGGAGLDAVNKWDHTCTSIAAPEVLEPLKEARKKRRMIDDSGPSKRPRTALEQLRAWANEWPIKEQVVGKTIDFKDEDVVTSNEQYAVVKNPGGACAARLRVSEKHFVVDHAAYFENQPWFKDLPPEEWCSTLGVIQDEVGDAVSAIKTVVTGQNPTHFTLPLVERKTTLVAGYVHATYTADKNEMSIAHLKVDSDHMGRGLGGLLIDAAEDHSKSVGWKCKKVYLSVLKANARARRCYSKAGFKFESGSTACWGDAKHSGSEWQRWRKVHKHPFMQKKGKTEKQ